MWNLQYTLFHRDTRIEIIDVSRIWYDVEDHFFALGDIFSGAELCGEFEDVGKEGGVGGARERDSS